MRRFSHLPIALAIGGLLAGSSVFATNAFAAPPVSTSHSTTQSAGEDHRVTAPSIATGDEQAQHIGHPGGPGGFPGRGPEPLPPFHGPEQGPDRGPGHGFPFPDPRPDPRPLPDPGRGPGHGFPDPGRGPVHDPDPGHGPVHIPDPNPGRGPGHLPDPNPGHGHGPGLPGGPIVARPGGPLGGVHVGGGRGPVVFRGGNPHQPFVPVHRIPHRVEPIIVGHPYGGQWHPLPRYEYCNGFYFGGVIYAGPYPFFFGYDGWAPTEWFYDYDTGTWWSPATGYVGAPPVLLNVPITVMVQEQEPVLDDFGFPVLDINGDPVYETVTVYYNAYFDPAYGAYGYRNSAGDFIWLQW